MQEWKIVYENEHVIIVDKPCGLAIQSADEDAVKGYKSQHDLDLFPITRIDQPVSGLCLLAKSKKAAAHYTQELTSNNIAKSYVAVVEGKFPTDITKVENLLIKKGTKAMEDKKYGKQCILHIQSVTHLDRYSILRLTISTGRFHQIRAQLALLGHPVKGDLKYMSKRSNKEGGIYLHCDTLKMKIDEEEMVFSAPYPEDKPLYKLG